MARRAAGRRQAAARAPPGARRRLRRSAWRWRTGHQADAAPQLRRGRPRERGSRRSSLAVAGRAPGRRQAAARAPPGARRRSRRSSLAVARRAPGRRQAAAQARPAARSGITAEQPGGGGPGTRPAPGRRQAAAQARPAARATIAAEQPGGGAQGTRPTPGRSSGAAGREGGDRGGAAWRWRAGHQAGARPQLGRGRRRGRRSRRSSLAVAGRAPGRRQAAARVPPAARARIAAEQPGGGGQGTRPTPWPQLGCRRPPGRGSRRSSLAVAGRAPGRRQAAARVPPAGEGEDHGGAARRWRAGHQADARPQLGRRQPPGRGSRRSSLAVAGRAPGRCLTVVAQSTFAIGPPSPPSRMSGLSSYRRTLPYGGTLCEPVRTLRLMSEPACDGTM